MGGQSITESSSAIARRMYNDVWSSSYWEYWTQVSVNVNWSPRCGHSVAIFLSSMYVIGGIDVSRYYSDVWVSTNGILWTMVVETYIYYETHNVSHTCVLKLLVYETLRYIIDGSP
jgi:hypothetical protein